MKALKVTAHLHHSFHTNNEWTPALDGILAYQHLLKKLGSQQFNNDIANNKQTTVDDMPISKNDAGEWFYHCSFPIFSQRKSVKKQHYKRFNVDESQYLQCKTKALQTTKGIHKNWTYSRNLIVTDKIEWHIIADKEWLQETLINVSHIGGNRKTGNGRVVKWDITSGDSKIAKKFRAIPVDLLVQPNTVTTEWGIRPSVRLPENRFICSMVNLDAL